MTAWPQRMICNNSSKTSFNEHTFSMNGLVIFKIFENFSCKSFDHRFGFSIDSNFHNPSGCDFDFMTIIGLKIYKGIDLENVSLILSLILHLFQNYYRYQIKMSNSKIMKMLELNLNPMSEISYEAI